MSRNLTEEQNRAINDLLRAHPPEVLSEALYTELLAKRIIHLDGSVDRRIDSETSQAINDLLKQRAKKD